MRNFSILAAVALALAACAPSVPDSGAKTAGVGFGDYDQYATERQAALAGPQPQTVPPPAISAQPLGAGTGAAIGAPAPNTGNLAADVSATLAATAPAGATPAAAPVAPLPAAPLPADPAQGAVIGATGLAPGVDMGAPAPAASNPNIVPVTPLPERTDSDRPNIVAYAIASKNPVGQQAYPRSNPFRDNANARACAKYASADRAQEDFLAAGGPERDGKSLDPDGDGFACSWDPTPFRMGGN